MSIGCEVTLSPRGYRLYFQEVGSEARARIIAIVKVAQGGAGSLRLTHLHKCALLDMVWMVIARELLDVEPRQIVLGVLECGM